MSLDSAPAVSITDHGSVVGFTPLTPEAKTWFDKNVASEGWQWMGSTLYVDHRMADDLAAGLENEGMV
jgi:hypothetical protein